MSVAQWAVSPNLCGTVAMIPPTLPDGPSPRDQRVEIVGADLQRHDNGVATPGGERPGNAVGGFHLGDRVADDRHDQRLAGQDGIGVHEISTVRSRWVSRWVAGSSERAACRAAT